MKSKIIRHGIACALAALLLAGGALHIFAAVNGRAEALKNIIGKFNRLTPDPAVEILTFSQWSGIYAPAGFNPSTLTGNDLADYADKVFELANKERKKAGVPLLARSDSLDEAALTRALECASVNSLFVNGKAHARPDGSPWFTVFGVKKNYNYGENLGQGGSAEIRMDSFMKSEGHRANILKEDYTETGIGCAVSDQGEIFMVQVFYRPSKQIA